MSVYTDITLCLYIFSSRPVYKLQCAHYYRKSSKICIAVYREEKLQNPAKCSISKKCIFEGQDVTKRLHIMFNLSYVNEFSFLTCTFKSVKIKGVYENENNKSLLAEQVQEMFLTEKKKLEKLQ